MTTIYRAYLVQGESKNIHRKRRPYLVTIGRVC
jgi:hypothetical protein